MTDLLTIADELYALTLPEFTPARDARAKELKKGDHADLAAPVKALKKPSTAAWVLNLFVRREGEQVQQVLDMGAALREAQSGMSGDDLRALTRQRRQLTAAVTQQARSLASESGVRVTQAVAEQVEATFTAAMVDARCGEAVRSGLLVTTLTTTGVDEVDLERAVAVPDALGHTASTQSAPSAPSAPSEPTRPDLRVVPDPDAELKARAAAQETLDEATSRADEAQAALDAAAAQVEQLQAKALQSESEIEELKRRLAALESAYDEIDDDLGDAEDARSEAQTALDEASAERDAAARALKSL